MKEGVRETFQDEALELLADLEQVLLELERRPTDPDLVGRAFRHLHTIKGSGGMAGFTALAEFTHEVETVFECIRQGELTVDGEIIGLFLAVRDLLARMAEAPPEEAWGERPVTRELVARLRSYQKGGAGDGLSSVREDSYARRGAAGQARFRIRFRPPVDIFRRGLDPSRLLGELERLGACRTTLLTDRLPPLEELDPEECHLGWEVELVTDAGIDAIRDLFIFVEDDSELTIEPLEQDTADPEMDDRDSGPAGQGNKEGGTIRVGSAKLDSLVDLIGELVTVQARLSRTVAGQDHPELGAIAEEVERLTWELRDQVLNIRMVPVGTTFTALRRLVRDLAMELGKDVELMTEGGETELDKTVIERLQEPLVHIIRNCIDHGIEPPEERCVAGKPARGRITLAASHSGGHVVLRIRDDGAGLDREKLVLRARQLGLLPEESEPGDRELHELIFAPGFSTAEEVTSVSGRGVGMDVVRQAIEGLRGSVEVSSQAGEGTTFSLKLPLTLAIIDGLKVDIGGDTYVMPLAEVEECIEIRRRKVEERCLVEVRGEIVPYISLRERFGAQGEPPSIEQIVIANLEERRIGFVVDKVVGEHQTVIKSLGRMYRDIRGLSGATILGDGRVALILDLAQMARMEEILEGETLSGL